VIYPNISIYYIKRALELPRPDISNLENYDHSGLGTKAITTLNQLRNLT